MPLNIKNPLADELARRLSHKTGHSITEVVIDALREQLRREPRPLPTLTLKRKPASIFDYQFEDIEITGYDPHPPIKYPVAV